MLALMRKLGVTEFSIKGDELRPGKDAGITIDVKDDILTARTK